MAHTLQAGFKGIGSILDPLLRLYFSDEFARAMDEHARTEFPMLGERLRARAGDACLPLPSWRGMKG
ncbi:MAG: hypothetical protein BWY25_03109 [Chloroflexi bacterium ADurb.Bin222]|nr:MAG: hypothetical protein BWY25_03109 [Chloroflexi bacterium ADurb.Bin222]